MVGVRGVNPTGNTFIVQGVVNSLPAEQPACGSGIDPQQPCCIMAAAGPYTTNDSVCYTPLEHLLQHAQGKEQAGTTWAHLFYNRMIRIFKQYSGFQLRVCNMVDNLVVVSCLETSRFSIAVIHVYTWSRLFAAFVPCIATDAY